MMEYKNGRHFTGRLPRGKDLIISIEDFCKEASIQMATFSVIGAVSSATLGFYDQQKRVYETFTKKAPHEIASCIGNVSLKEGKPFIHAHVVLGGQDGKTTGGHLFSETIIFAGEINLQELIGTAMERNFDTTTGLFLWKQSVIL